MGTAAGVCRGRVDGAVFSVDRLLEVWKVVISDPHYEYFFAQRENCVGANSPAPDEDVSQKLAMYDCRDLGR